MNTTNNNGQATIATETSAFDYLKKLPKNLDRAALHNYPIDRESQEIDHEIAQDFTDTFRSTTNSFDIPVSWTMTKDALVKLLGITKQEGFDEVNGIRFYAGINPDNQLTLIAVSTRAGNGCNDDLTEEDQYPYYDYADPCPNNCSNRGNLRVQGGNASSLKVIITE